MRKNDLFYRPHRPANQMRIFLALLYVLSKIIPPSAPERVPQRLKGDTLYLEKKSFTYFLSSRKSLSREDLSLSRRASTHPEIISTTYGRAGRASRNIDRVELKSKRGVAPNVNCGLSLASGAFPENKFLTSSFVNRGTMLPVLVHSCFKAVEPFPVGVGKLTSQRIFHENPNSSCRCAYFTTFRERDAKLAAGEAFVVAAPISNGFRIEWKEIVLAGKDKGPPWWRPLKQWDVDAAIMGSVFQAARIETYGRLVEGVRLKLLRPAPEGVRGWS